MPFTIIGAARAGADGTLLALSPLAGIPLAEHQARRAAAAGASPIMLLVETITPDLVALVGRLRHDGIAADLTDAIATLADRGDGLLIADGCLPEPGLIAALVRGSTPAVATIADGPGLDGYERIDANTRWAGAALIAQETIAEVAAMLGDWDPVSTLLRRAVQQGAAQVDAGRPPPLAGQAGDLAGAEHALIVSSRPGHDDWIAQRLVGPLADCALPWLLARQIEPGVLASGAALLAGVGGLAALLGLRWPVLIALLLAEPAAGVADQLARIQSRPIGSRRALRWTRRAAVAVAALGLGWSLMTESGQWGWLLVATLTIAALAGLAGARTAVPRPRWYARAGTLAWEMLPFALFGRWGLGLAVLTVHAAASLAAAITAWRDDQRRSSGG